MHWFFFNLSILNPHFLIIIKKIHFLKNAGQANFVNGMIAVYRDGL
jgi:hypothetical protein